MASSAWPPSVWVNAPAESLQPRSRIADLIRSRSCRQRTTRSASAPRTSASSIARSSATQHMSLEWRKWRGSSRTSQIPWSGSCHSAAAASATSTRNSATAGRQLLHLVPQPVRRSQKLAVDVELPLVPGAIAHSHRPALAPAGEMRQRALGEIALAVYPEHDLETAAPGGAAAARPSRGNRRTDWLRRDRPPPRAPPA